MIKNSTKLIEAAHEEMKLELQRSIEKGKEPSYYEMFFIGYGHGLIDMRDDISKKVSEWLYKACNDGLLETGNMNTLQESLAKIFDHDA